MKGDRSVVPLILTYLFEAGTLYSLQHLLVHFRSQCIDERGVIARSLGHCLHLLLLVQILVDLDARFDAVHDWHLDVENDDLKVALVVTLDDVDGLPAILRRDHVVKVWTQRVLEARQQERVIVGE